MLLTCGSVIAEIVYLSLYFLQKYEVINLTAPPPGLTTVLLMMIFFGGVQCLLIGILGEYLAKTYMEVKGRPLWVIHKTAGFPPEEEPLGPEKING